MKHILLLVKNPHSYKELITTLLLNDMSLNIISYYTTSTIQELLEHPCDLIIIEDDLTSSLAANSAKYIAKFYPTYPLVFISAATNIPKELSNVIDYSQFILNYPQILKEYNIYLNTETACPLIEPIPEALQLASHEISKVIVLIDDDPISLDIASTILESHFYTVLKFQSGVETLSLLHHLKSNSHCISLIILDLMMPQIDGFQLLREIRNLPEFENTPVLITSSLNDYDSVQEIMKYTPNGYIVKPFNRELLLNKVQTLIS